MARRPDQVIVNKEIKKRTCRKVNFTIPANHKVKLKESEKRNKCLALVRELKKTMEHESDGDTSCCWCARYSHQRISKRTGELGNKRTRGNH